MAEITLVRHGQASFGADNYDSLSDVGHQQSRWLGNHWRKLEKRFDRVVTGTMVRHEETAAGILQGLGQSLTIVGHYGLNEYDFQGLLYPFKAQYPALWMETGHAKHDYYHNIKQALSYWMDGTIATDGKDSWENFCERVQTAFAFVLDTDAKRTLVISSGGPIAVILQLVLMLNDERTCDLSLQIKNSSCHKLLYNGSQLTLDSFNDVGHLLTDDKRHAITFS